MPEVFGSRQADEARRQQELVDRLYQQIGQLKVELDWLKKNLDWTVERKRMAIDLNHPSMPIARQCELLGLDRSSAYYRRHNDDGLNEQLMRLIDAQYLQTPF